MQLSVVLLTAFLVLPCTGSRARHKGTSGPQADTLGKEAPWPLSLLFPESKQCGVVAGDWARAGAIWTAGTVSAQQLPTVREASPCTAGFAVHQHGDGNNVVETRGDGAFLYVAGAEVGTGAGATICDVDNKPAQLEYVYTDGLTGCMGLSIVGKRKGDGTRDMFFAHSRRWSDYGRHTSVLPENDPLAAAQEFVRSHVDLNVFFGSGDHTIGRDGHYEISQEATILSSILGVWVMNDVYHNVALSSMLAFSIQHEAWVRLSGEEERVHMFTRDEADSRSKFITRPWEPSQELIDKLALLQSSSDDKISLCGGVLRAYAAGDFSTLGAMHRGKTESHGKELEGLLKECYEDMAGKGYQTQQHDAMQLQFNRAVGLHTISTPRLGR